MGERDGFAITHGPAPDRTLGLTRRDFCARSCWSALALAGVAGFAALSEACGGGGPTGPSGNLPSLPVVTGIVANNTLTVTVDSSSPLASIGAAALVQGASVPVLAVHTGDNAFSAFSAICTHQTCTITGFANNRFVCPCHGSQFDTSGNVVSGPAAQRLSRYNTQFAGTTLTIS